MTTDNQPLTPAPTKPRCLMARWVVPISRPPIQGGWVQITGDKIVDLGQGEPPSAAKDLGDVALLPGLVNAHTHLEFSDCRQPIGSSGILLCDWIGEVIAARSNATPQQKSDAIADGIRQSQQAGVSLIAEITTPPCTYPRNAGEPEICSLAEVLGLSPQRGQERLASATRHLAADLSSGLSPHAPYSVSRELLQACVEMAVRQQRTIAMHVAESPAERELLASGTGDFARTLKNIGVWQAGLYPWPGDAIADLIEQLSKAPRALVIHGNDLSDSEIALLAQHPRMTVVYCPRTHAFFGYSKHPVERLLAAGVRVALGTDSRASNPDLSVWKEIQYLLQHRTDLDPQSVIEMGTIHGADALGRTDVGRIEGGARAVIGFVRTQANSSHDLYASFAESDFHPLTSV